MVQQEICRTAGILERPRAVLLKEDVELAFELPAGARPTRLSSDVPVFWELEVRLELDGLDFRETCLVPIY